MNALEIRNLSKHYDGFSLENLSLTLPEGCVLGLVGENGAGKTTTIKIILDMLPSDGGTVTVLGQDSRGNVAVKQDLGVVMDTVGLPPCVTAIQVEKIMAPIYQNWDPETYHRFLKTFDLPETKKFGDYSKGMQMKLGLAIALSHGAKLLLLDEATSGLDPVVRDQVVNILLDFAREGGSVLISSHIVSDLEKLCDYVAFLHKGKLMLCEEKDYLLGEYGVVHCTKPDLENLPEEGVLHKKESPYGVEALVKRSALPKGRAVSPVTMEELFIYMSKEAG